MFNDIYSTFNIEKRKFLKFSKPSYAFAYYKSYKLNLLNNTKESFNLEELVTHFYKIKVDNTFNEPRVIHLFYELGNLFIGENSSITEDDLLAIEVVYREVKQHNFSESTLDSDLNLIDSPSYELYKKTFIEGYEHLLDGNCYQFNLTFPYTFRFDSKIKPENMMAKIWKDDSTCSPYAHIKDSNNNYNSPSHHYCKND